MAQGQAASVSDNILCPEENSDADSKGCLLKRLIDSRPAPGGAFPARRQSKLELPIAARAELPQVSLPPPLVPGAKTLPNTSKSTPDHVRVRRPLSADEAGRIGSEILESPSMGLRCVRGKLRQSCHDVSCGTQRQSRDRDRGVGGTTGGKRTAADDAEI